VGPGSLLRSHRRRRRLSQLALANAAGISARHLSFIETGRSRPGRAVVAALARAMALPHRETNRILRSLGEAPLYPDVGIDDEAVRALRAALERMLEAHMPWPAVVMDRAWCAVRANPAFECLLDRLVGHTETPPSERGLMEWLFARDGLQPLVVNWPEVAPFLLRRVRHESVLHPDLDELAERLEGQVDPRVLADPEPGGQGVVLPLHLRVDGQEVRLFSLLAGFGSALDAGMEELRLECFCPADGDSERWLTHLVADTG